MSAEQLKQPIHLFVGVPRACTIVNRSTQTHESGASRTVVRIRTLPEPPASPKPCYHLRNPDVRVMKSAPISNTSVAYSVSSARSHPVSDFHQRHMPAMPWGNNPALPRTTQLLAIWRQQPRPSGGVIPWQVHKARPGLRDLDVCVRAQVHSSSSVGRAARHVTGHTLTHVLPPAAALARTKHDSWIRAHSGHTEIVSGGCDSRFQAGYTCSIHPVMQIREARAHQRLVTTGSTLCSWQQAPHIHI